MKTMRDQIVARIGRLGEGKAFSAKDFLDIASRTTVDVTLAELTRTGSHAVYLDRSPFSPTEWRERKSALLPMDHLVDPKLDSRE